MFRYLYLNRQYKIASHKGSIIILDIHNLSHHNHVHGLNKRREFTSKSRIFYYSLSIFMVAYIQLGYINFKPF